MVTLNRQTLERLARFTLVGGTGFIVDAGLTMGLQVWGADIYTSRLIAISLAMFVTWRLNRAITFGASSRGQVREGALYVGVALAAATLNYGIYVGLMLFVPGMIALVAVGAATCVSMVLSYLGYSKLVFRSA